MHYRFISKAALAALAIAGVGSSAVSEAWAAVPPERDEVYASVAGDSIRGYVNWHNYNSGSGQVTIYNQMNDGLCVSAQQRVMRNNVWSAWTDLVVGCYEPSYVRGVYTNNTGQRIQYWQFRVRDANSSWAYDTNSPGGD